VPGLLARSVMPTQKVQTENAKKYTAETAHSWWLAAKVTRQVTGRSIINTTPSIQELATSCGQQRLAPDAKSCGGDYCCVECTSNCGAKLCKCPPPPPARRSLAADNFSDASA
jgi:hypothetical protein